MSRFRHLAAAAAAAVALSACGDGAPGDPAGSAPPGSDGARLPAAAPVRAASPDDAAAELARIALTGATEADRLGAILAAVERAGIAVRDPLRDDRVVREPAAPAQGIALMVAEVVALERVLAAGHEVALADIAELITRAAAPELDLTELPLEAYLLEGIRDAATNGTPTQRFWARFIAELGRQHPGGHDILAGAGAREGDVVLDGLQAGLVLLRLAGDFAARAAEATPARASIFPIPGIAAAFPQDPPRGDCRMGDQQSMLMDAVAAGASSTFDRIADAIGDQIDRSGSAWARQAFSRARFAHKIAGTGLGILKLFVAGSLTRATIEFADGSTKLVRTRSRQREGEQKQLRATLRLDAGGLQAFNCYRILLAGAGLDFNVGNDGAIEGAEVRWRILEGGASGRRVDPGIIQFRGDPRRTPTDRRGQATIVIEGKPQPYTIPDGATETEKRAVVRVEYTMKGSDLYKDLFDSILAFAGGPIGIALELLQRMVPLGDNFAFPVVDYAADYRIDHRHLGGPVRFTGTKCGGPAGTWEIDISGDLGEGMTVTGQIVATFDYQGARGPFHLSMDTNVPPQARKFVRFQTTKASGRATLSQDGALLRLVPSDVSAAVTFYDRRQTITHGEPLEIPVRLGDFCD